MPERCVQSQLSNGALVTVLDGVPGYAAVKGAVEVLTVYMAKELGGRGVAVNTVVPGADQDRFWTSAIVLQTMISIEPDAGANTQLRSYFL